EASKQEKIELQVKLMDAVMTGQGWDVVPPELRKQADSLWFKSWLSFDPAEAMRRTNQPVLILQGALDVQVPPSHADALEAMAAKRGGSAATTARKIVGPGVMRLLGPASTGEVEEYATLQDKNGHTAVTDARSAWFNEVLPARR